MSFTDKINTDLKTAMKAKDKDTMRTLRAIKSAILLANTDGTGEEMTEERGVKILQKLLKQRKESLDIYNKQGREELAATEQAEISVLERYLPEAMSEEDVEKAIQGIITETGATSMQDMGKVMGMATKKLAGQADGRVISGIVRKLLS